MNTTIRFLSGVALIMLFCCYHAHAGNLNISPEPQKIIARSSASKITIDDKWQVLFDDISPALADYPKDENPYHFSAKELVNGLKEHGIILHTNPYSEPSTGSKRIILGNSVYNQKIKEICLDKGINIDDLPYDSADSRYDESYILDISSNNNGIDEIIIAARGAAGVFYGVQTLLQLMDGKQISSARIIDYPDMKWRGLYRDFKDITSPKRNNKVSKNNKLIPSIKEIQRFSSLKLNTIIFLGHEFLDMQKNGTFLKNIFRECRKRFITPIPSLPSRMPLYARYKDKLWNKSDLISSASGYWVRNEPFYFNNDGGALPLAPVKDLLENGSFEIDMDRNEDPDSWIIDNVDNNMWRRIGITDELHSANSVHSGKYAMALSVYKPKNLFGINLIPFSETAPNGQIGVEPLSLYYLTYWARIKKKGSLKIRSRIFQHKESGRRLEEVFTWPLDHKLNENWQKIIEPIFTHKECSNIKIKFKASNPSDNRQEIYLDDVKLFRLNGALLNVIDTPQTHMEIKSIDGSILYESGKDYHVIRRDFLVKPLQSIDKLLGTSIVLTKESKIQKFDVIKISYDCALLNPFFRREKLSPTSFYTYKLYRKNLENLLELEPKYINVNLDEFHGAYNRDSRCLKRNISNAGIYAEFVNSINHILHNNGGVEVLPGLKLRGLGKNNIKLIMFDDMVNYWHYKKGDINSSFGSRPGRTYLAMPGTPVKEDKKSLIKKKSYLPISSDIVMASWSYGEDKQGKMANCRCYYESRKFDYFGCPWSNEKNIRRWASLLRRSKALGLVKATWNGQMNGLELMAALAWNNLEKQ